MFRFGESLWNFFGKILISHFMLVRWCKNMNIFENNFFLRILFLNFTCQLFRW